MCESYPITIFFDEEEEMETPIETIAELAVDLGLGFDVMERIIRYKDVLEIVGTRIYVTREHVIDEDASPHLILRYMKSVFYPDDNRVCMIFTVGESNKPPDWYTCAEFECVGAALSALLELYNEHGIESPDTLDKVYMLFCSEGQQMCDETGDYQRYDLGRLEQDMHMCLFEHNLWPMIGKDVHKCDGYGYVYIDVGPKYVTNQYMTTSIDYSVLHNWYSSAAFTPTTAVQYRYFVKSGGKFSALKFSNVSLELDYINNKYGGQLKKIFPVPSNNKMYVQVVGSDLYFVVPTVDAITKNIFGSHYSFHNIKNYIPDYNPSLVYKDTIDIHKTIYDETNKKTIHGPKCVIHNGLQVPMKKDGLKLDNAVCLNKRSGAHSFYSAVFSDQVEKDVISDILSLPYQAKIASASRAATKIATAYRAHRARNARSAKNTLVGGTDHEAVYVILVRVGNQWHKTFNLLDGSGAIVDWFHTVGSSIAQKTLLAEIKGFLAGGRS